MLRQLRRVVASLVEYVESLGESAGDVVSAALSGKKWNERVIEFPGEMLLRGVTLIAAAEPGAAPFTNWNALQNIPCGQCVLKTKNGAAGRVARIFNPCEQHWLTNENMFRFP